MSRVKCNEVQPVTFIITCYYTLTIIITLTIIMHYHFYLGYHYIIFTLIPLLRDIQTVSPHNGPHYYILINPILSHYYKGAYYYPLLHISVSGTCT